MAIFLGKSAGGHTGSPSVLGSISWGEAKIQNGRDKSEKNPRRGGGFVKTISDIVFAPPKDTKGMEPVVGIRETYLLTFGTTTSGDFLGHRTRAREHEPREAEEGRKKKMSGLFNRSGTMEDGGRGRERGTVRMGRESGRC
jgi:hypothetical protein